MKKRLILAVLSVFSCMMLLAACGQAKTETKKFDYDPARMLEMGENAAEQWGNVDFSSYIDMQGVPDEQRTLYESQAAIQKEAGAFKEIKKDSGNIKELDTLIRVSQTIICENGEVLLNFDFDQDYQLVNFSSERIIGLAEKMERAALNTVFGMAFIFAVLIFISLVIKALSLVPKFLAKKTETPVQQKTSETVPAPAVQIDNAVLKADELTAVITAAIAAYTADNREAPADGLVVRSIKRRNVSQWKNA